MIDFTKTKKGDILRLVGEGAPGYAELGDLLRVTDVLHNSVMVEDRNGATTEFIFNCGAARLEPTEWKDDFPEEATVKTQSKNDDKAEMLVKYIGFKIIKARPMELQKCNKLHGKPVVEGGDEQPGYLVVYPDAKGVFSKNSYESWSPRDVFEAVYRVITCMTFGLAIEAMKKGKKVARHGWNGKNMFVYLVHGGRCQKYDLINEAAKHVRPITLDGTSVDICPHIDMKAADGSIVIGWLASQTDILAEDWCIVE